RVNKAYAVLSDPDRRRSYDETGSTSEKKSLDEQALELFMAMLREAISQDDLGIVAYTRMAVERTTESVKKKSTQTQRAIEKLEKKRAKVRYIGSGENLIQQLIDAQIAEHRATLEQCTAALQLAQRASKLV